MPFVDKNGAPLGTNQERLEVSRVPVLGIVGLFIAVAGLVFLFNPGVETSVGQVANLHNLFVGQTLTISGVIFIAVQWRPRCR